MKILRDFERRLEGAVEGLFARAFRSGVQPVELGKRLVREVEDGRTVGVNRVYVPNVYVYELSPGDRERFANYEQALAQELAALAVETARERGWGMLGPARVEFETAEDLEQGRFRLGSRVEAAEAEAGYEPPSPAGAAAAPPVGPHTAMLPGQRPSQRVRAPATLVLISGGQPVRVYPLAAPELSIGRSDHSGIALSDPGVSRNHARILREGDDFIIEDLRSTNGTEVNGQPVRRRRLADGDVIKLASSTLQFRREG
jgi:Protein of unknown function (DUF3662)/FHA domain